MARGLLLLLFVGAVGNASGSSLSCRERGFADALQCSGCKKMHDLVKDDGACVTTPDLPLLTLPLLHFRPHAGAPTVHLTAYGLLSFLYYASNPCPSARPALHPMCRAVPGV